MKRHTGVNTVNNVDRLHQRKCTLVLLSIVSIFLLAQAACTRDDLVSAVSTLTSDLQSTIEPFSSEQTASSTNLATSIPLATVPADLIDQSAQQPTSPLAATEPTAIAIPAPITEPTVTSSPTTSPTATLPPTLVPTEEPLPTATPEPKATPIPAEIPVNGGSMSFIPGGFFEMGASADALLEECNTFREGCEADWFTASNPPHLVLVAPYYLDTYEVTNEAFVTFLGDIDATGDSCLGQPCLDFNESQIVESGRNFTVDPTLLTQPAAGITWYGATAFCEWRASRLPTEAEWEYAAGWDSRNAVKMRYPWGEDFDGNLVNFCDVNCDAPQANNAYDDGFATAAPVGSFEGGRSPSGVYDMAGNVWEWVSDWYAADFYSDAIFTNPVGPTEGVDKVVRGGSWFDTGNFTSTVIRFPSPPTNADKTIGFRCAMDLPRP